MKKIELLFIIMVAFIFISCDPAGGFTLPENENENHAEEKDTEKEDNEIETPKEDKEKENDSENVNEKPDTDQQEEEQEKDQEEEDEDEITDEEKGFADPLCGTQKGDAEIYAKLNELKPQESINVLGSAPIPDFVHLSWTSNPAGSMTFTWRTNDSQNAVIRLSVVRVSKNPDMSGYREIGPHTDLGPGIGQAYHLPWNKDWKVIHTAEICGLVPGTKYYYQVGSIDGMGAEFFSLIYSFRTAPHPDTPQDEVEYKFIAGGDSQSISMGGITADQFKGFMTAVLKEDPAFWINIGDNTNNQSDFTWLTPPQQQWEDMFIIPSKDTLPFIPTMGVHGNHEGISPIHYYAQFSYPGNEQWYSFAYGNSQFVVLNDTVNVDDSNFRKEGSREKEQAEFLESVLSSTDRTWKIIAHHRPMWTSTKDKSPELGLREWWGAIIDKYHAQLIFNGHHHNYERSKPIRNQSVVSDINEGSVYVISGGAGALTYATDCNPVHCVKSAREYHYVLVTVKGKTVTLEAKKVDKNGNTSPLDSVTYNLK